MRSGDCQTKSARNIIDKVGARVLPECRQDETSVKSSRGKGRFAAATPRPMIFSTSRDDVCASTPAAFLHFMLSWKQNGCPGIGSGIDFVMARHDRDEGK